MSGPDSLALSDDHGNSVELCPEHGAWWALGCDHCNADLADMAAFNEPGPEVELPQ